MGGNAENGPLPGVQRGDRGGGSETLVPLGFHWAWQDGPWECKEASMASLCPLCPGQSGHTRQTRPGPLPSPSLLGPSPSCELCLGMTLGMIRGTTQGAALARAAATLVHSFGWHPEEWAVPTVLCSLTSFCGPAPVPLNPTPHVTVSGRATF